MPSYFVSPVDFDKKIFVFSLYKHRKIDSVPWRPCFQMDKINFSNLGRGHPRTICAKLFSNWPISGSFLCFPYLYIYVGKGVCHVFQWIKSILAILVKGHTRTICAKLFSNWLSSF